MAKKAAAARKRHLRRTSRRRDGAKWVAGLKGSTGKTLEQWIALVKKEGPKGEKERASAQAGSTNSAPTPPGGLRNGRSKGERGQPGRYLRLQRATSKPC